MWAFAKAFAQAVAKNYPDLVTAEYRVEKRPPGRVLVDYNQNRWGATLASVYSVRPSPFAGVSTPVTWSEIEKGFAIKDFRLETVRPRFQSKGDLFGPTLSRQKRFDLAKLVK